MPLSIKTKRFVIALRGSQLNSTWVTFRVIEVKVILSEGLQAALVVSKSMSPSGSGWYDSIYKNTKVHLFIFTQQFSQCLYLIFIFVFICICRI